jgi:cytochrome P450
MADISVAFCNVSRFTPNKGRNIMAGLANLEIANPHWVKRAEFDDLSHIPGEQGPPVIGNTLKLLADPDAFSRRMFETYGPVFRNRAFGGVVVIMLGPDANEMVLFDRGKNFSSEQGWGPILNLLFPRGLMLMDFDAHRADRKTLGVAFKPEPMRGYAEGIQRVIGNQLPDWPKDGQTEMLFYPAIKQLTLDIAAECFLGIPLGPEADRLNTAFVDSVAASIGIIRRPLPFTAMKRGVDGRQAVIDYLRPQIQERRRNPNRTDMFSQFCRATQEDGSFLPDDSILDHMNFLLMAAHDTITSSVTSFVYYLAKNPEWQEKLRAEALSIAPAGAALTMEQLDQFTLTEMAFKEALRMMPPVPAMPRRAVRAFEFGGYHIPAGTNLSINTSFVHRMPDIWPEPERFDPMRFTAEAVRARHKYAWVPFGGGAHMCLGLHFAYMQMKVFMHQLLTTRRIEIAAGYTPKWQAWPIPKPVDGLKVRLRAL